MLPKQFDLTGLFETPLREARQPADPWCPFHHSRRWHLEAFEQPIEGRPAEASPLTAPIEPLEQNATGFVAVATQTLGVSYDSIVVPMARILGPQGLHQLGKRTAPFGLDPFGEPLNRSSQFLATGAALNGGLPAVASPPGKLKSQEIKPTVVPSTPRPTAGKRSNTQSRPRSGTTGFARDTLYASVAQTIGPARNANTRWPTPEKRLPVHNG